MADKRLRKVLLLKQRVADTATETQTEFLFPQNTRIERAKSLVSKLERQLLERQNGGGIKHTVD